MYLKSKIFLSFLFVLVFVFPVYALSSSNDQIAKNNTKSDLSLISANKFTLITNNESHEIYYGLVLGESSDLDYNGKITSMSIMPEKKSLLINFDNILQTDNVWIRFPNNVISADKEKFVLIIDGAQRGYELTSYGDDTRLGFILEKGTHHVEIIGNNVIPEFSSNTLLVFLLVASAIIIFPRMIVKIYR